MKQLAWIGALIVGLGWSGPVSAEMVYYHFLDAPMTYDTEGNGVCIYSFTLHMPDESGTIWADQGCGIVHTEWYHEIWVPGGAKWVPVKSGMDFIAATDSTLTESAGNFLGIPYTCVTNLKAEVTLICGGQCASCGGQSGDACWCDEKCADFGDCCTNKETVCSPPKEECKKKTWYYDKDGDGYGSTLFKTAITACQQPGGYVADNTDCNDAVAEIHPGANGLQVVVCEDMDNDGYGNPSAQLVGNSCEVYAKVLGNPKYDANGKKLWVTAAEAKADGSSPPLLWQCDDCDDAKAEIHPGVKDTYCHDADKDQHGDMASKQEMDICEQKKLDPANAFWFSVKDMPCDDKCGENVGTVTEPIWWKDTDGDGWVDLPAADANGNQINPLVQCGPPSGNGWVVEEKIAKGTNELGDIESDCDITNPEENPETAWYLDNDSDGLGASLVCWTGCKATYEKQKKMTVASMPAECQEVMAQKAVATVGKITAIEKATFFGIMATVKTHRNTAQKPPKSAWQTVMSLIETAIDKVTGPTHRQQDTKSASSSAPFPFTKEGGDCDDDDKETGKTAKFGIDLDGDGESEKLIPFETCELPADYQESHYKKLCLALGYTEDMCDLYHDQIHLVTKGGDCQPLDKELNSTKTFYMDLNGNGFGDESTQVTCAFPVEGKISPSACLKSLFWFPGCRESLLKACQAKGDTDICAELMSKMQWVEKGGECNDLSPTPEGWLADADGDKAGDCAALLCAPSSTAGLISVMESSGCDCADTDAQIAGPTTYYADTDSDGFGDYARPHTVCPQEEQTVAGLQLVEHPNDLADYDYSATMLENLRRGRWFLRKNLATAGVDFCSPGNVTPAYLCVPHALLPVPVWTDGPLDYALLTKEDLQGIQEFADSYIRTLEYIIAVAHVEDEKLGATTVLDSLPFIQVTHPFSSLPFLVNFDKKESKIIQMTLYSLNYYPSLVGGALSSVAFSEDVFLWTGIGTLVDPNASFVDYLPKEAVFKVEEFKVEGNEGTYILVRDKKKFPVQAYSLDVPELPPELYNAIPWAKDGDHDFLDDDAEILEYGLSASTQDQTSPDGKPDGVPDGYDTDNDGVSDGIELLAAHNIAWPAKLATVTPKYGYDQYLTAYSINDMPPAWWTAFKSAQQKAITMAPLLWEKVVETVPAELLVPGHTLEEAISGAQPAFLVQTAPGIPFIVAKKTPYSLGLCCGETPMPAIWINISEIIFGGDSVPSEWPDVERQITQTLLHEAVHWVFDIPWGIGDQDSIENLGHDYIETVLDVGEFSDLVWNLLGS